MLQNYLENMPNLHTWDQGATWNRGGFEAVHFRPLHDLIAEVLPPRPAFIETGAGNSTIFFLLHQPSRVVSIAPDAPLFERIESYCARSGIDLAPLEKHVECSEWVLPKMARNTPPAFDFALIDGDHSVEREVIDFFYLNHLLRKGGLLVIDDMHAPASKIVARLIKDEEDFRPMLDLRKAMVFQKQTDRPTLRPWHEQSYIRQEMELYSRTLDPFKVEQLTSHDLEKNR